MQFSTAFLLGFVGSAHCAGMCGPLALALPGGKRGMFIIGRVLYNLGRVVTYMAMGSVFGLLGHGFALAGLQRWLSLGLGVIILAGLFSARRFASALPVTRAVQWLKATVSKHFQRRELTSLFTVGMLNGL